jgi:DNA-binding CsgD family transcriptional regulator
LSLQHADRVRAIAEELDTLRCDGKPVLDTVLPPIRELLDVETMVAYRLREQTGGWDLDMFHAWGAHSSERVRALLHGLLVTTPKPFGTYDPSRPEPAQRNRVIEASRTLLAPDAELPPMYPKVFQPLGLSEHYQPRALVCEGPSLLAWLGAFHPEPPSPIQLRLLNALIPAVRRRLSLERKLRDAPRAFAALDAALELLGAPAFVVGDNAAIYETNTAARALLATQGRTIKAALVDTIARRPAAMHFELTPLRQPGASGFLAVLRTLSPEARIAQCVALATTRWSLSPRQSTVLELLVQGASNGLIAQSLRISESTVEIHVKALSDRIGAESRAQITALVLTLL